MTPKGEVWLASIESPVTDAERRHVTGLEIGLFSQTVAATYVETCLNTLSPAIPREKKSDHRELAEWCAAEPEKRVIFCDHGIAKDVVAVKLEDLQDIQSHGYSEWRRDGMECPYSEPIPVGLMYPAGDLHWRSDLEAAMRVTLLETWNKVTWESLVGGMRALEIELFDEATIWHRLGLDEEYESRGHHYQHGKKEHK